MLVKYLAPLIPQVEQVMLDGVTDQLYSTSETDDAGGIPDHWYTNTEADGIFGLLRTTS